MDVCREEFPGWTPVEGGGEVACHLHTGASGPARPIAEVAAGS